MLNAHDRAEVLIFLKTSCRFLLVPFIGFLISMYGLYLAGELYSINYAAELAMHEKVLFGRAYMAPDNTYFRKLLFLQKNPEITSLGNSRVLQLRSEFFNKDAHFINTGATPGVGIDGARRFIAQLPATAKLTTIILQLDETELFLEEDPSTEDTYKDYFAHGSYSRSNLVYAVTTLWKDYFHGKFTLSDLMPQKANARPIEMGISARVQKSGFRSDGSYNNGKVLSDPHNPNLEDYHFAKSIRSIDEGMSSFLGHTTPMPESTVTKLKSLMTLANQRHIHLVMYFPPFAPTMYTIMRQQHNDIYGYMDDAVARLSYAVSGTSHTLTDFTNPAPYGFTDENFIDGNHPAERLDARMLLMIAAHDKILASYLDSTRLQRALESSTDSRIIFPTTIQKAP